MKILYDYQILRSQKYGGISRYYYELIQYLKKQEDVCAEIRCLFSKNKYFEGKLDDYSCKDFKFLYGKSYINMFYFDWILNNSDYDIFHPTYYNPYYVEKCKGKVVITVHDMIHEIYPEMVHNAKKIIDWKKKCVNKADHIIAISERTKADLLYYFPHLTEEKISVVYHGGPREYATDIIEGIPSKYVLFVGQRLRYKNFDVLCKAMNMLMKDDPEIYLMCVGGGKFTKDELKKMRYPSRCIQYDLSDNKLNYAYQNAQCFVFPSKYEGFGIPILEAFGNNCPIILSNTSCFPEIAGDAALYFEPDNYKELFEKMRDLIYGNDKGKYIRKGISRLQNFSWDKVGTQTLDIYKALV
ncbi:MAG: glycosyltransferase family 4 protein [Butyrivibrio sp.]|nr:glycosyltransferase family 4 protein [Butyrivibrio sp.]